MQEDSIFLNSSNNTELSWGNFYIGQSKKEALDLLSKVKNIDQGSYKWALSTDGSFDDSISWRFFQTREKSGSISFKKEKIISLGLSYIKSIQISEIIEKKGFPKNVLIYSTKSGKQIYTQIFFIFPGGICTVNDETIKIDSDVFTIEPDMKIKYVFFSDPLLDPNQVNSGCLHGLPEEHLKFLDTWKGYGTYPIALME